MQITHHPLLAPSIGTQRHLTSLHFGDANARPKVVVQASLHADELPGMLVAHHLREQLAAAEASGLLRGQVVLVPVANPLGLDQTVLHAQLGRFDLATGENFNRNFPSLVDWITEPDDDVTPLLGTDPDANRATVRAALHRALDRHPPTTERGHLRHTLLRLACDADVVLDLHCDFEAVVHFYLEPACLEPLLPLTRRMGARAVLVAEGTGAHCFDEALSGVWWQLAHRLAQRHGEAFATQRPLPQGCVSTTVELRGQTDVRHDLARADAQALMDHLRDLGVVAGPAPEPPPALAAPTPLSGTELLTAPVSGVLTFHRAPGDHVAVGDRVAEVIDPITGTVHPLHASVNGVLYARHHLRWATPGLEVAKLSGAEPRRSGPLLGA